MKGFFAHIEDDTVKNEKFRKVVYTADYMQLVYMSLKPGEDIGLETHGNDQFFRIDKGEGEAVVDGNKYTLKDGDAVIVPAGAKHNVTNTSKTQRLSFYTIYAVPHHKDGVEFATKAAANASDEVFDGKTTEKS